MKSTRKEIAQTLLGILCTVFGAWTINSLSFVFLGGNQFYEHNFTFINTIMFGTWYLVASFLLVTAYPNISIHRMLFIGVITSAILVLTTKYWSDPNFSLLSNLILWLDAYIHNLVAIPIFWLIGAKVSKEESANATNT